MANRKENKGGNSKLKGRYWNCPDYVLNTLQNAVNKFEKIKLKNGKTEGYERAKSIIIEKSITYEQMKRIKNWFDSYDGPWENWDFQLNGGKTMQNWVEGQLRTSTSAVKNIKDAQKDAETNPENTHIKSHEKDNNKVNFKATFPTLPKLHKDISGQIKRGKSIYEEIERMKLLIIYESKI
jgi:hypothetical protein